MELLKVTDVSYTYFTKYQKIEAVKEVNCSFEAGGFYAITGESGSGKSTFMSLLAGLDLPTKGQIYVDGNDISKINRNEYRLNCASIVYQAFHLFPLLTALENVMLPMELKGVSRREAELNARELLNKVGLYEKIYKQYPKMMSGGEQQRVAIARAIASGGKILLADEPTGNLDTKNEEKVVEILKKLAHEEKYLVIIITHNNKIAMEADHILCISDGRLSVKNSGEAFK